MLTQEKPTIQVCAESTPKVWDRATTKANIGDIIHSPFTPVMEVINKDVYADGRVWLLVKPLYDGSTEEWVLESESIVQVEQQITQQGLAGDSLSCKLRQKSEAVATMAEWEEAVSLISPGYRIINGWFHDSSNGRCNLPPVHLTPRQVKILTGKIQVC